MHLITPTTNALDIFLKCNQNFPIFFSILIIQTISNYAYTHNVIGLSFMHAGITYLSPSPVMFFLFYSTCIRYVNSENHWKLYVLGQPIAL